MATKIIPANEILETPEVNILNDNVIDDMGYSYNNPYFEFKNYYQTTDNIFVLPAPETKTINNQSRLVYSQTFSQYSREESGTSQSNFTVLQTDIPYNNILYYDLIECNFNIGDNDIVEDDFRLEININNHLNRIIGIEGMLSTPQAYETSGTDFIMVDSYDELKNTWFNIDSLGRIISTKQGYIRNQLAIIKNGLNYTAYILAYVYGLDSNDATRVNSLNGDSSFVIKIKTLSSQNISVNEGSPFTLESNELIQGETKIDNTQISEFISNNIKKYYEYGKTNAKLLVDYTGDNEYAVGDIVVPMLDADEPMLKNPDNSPMEFEVTSSEISYDGQARQSLELIEKVRLMQTLTIPNITYIPPYPNEPITTAGQITVVDSKGNTYTNGSKIENGTAVTVTVTMRNSNYELIKLLQNGTEIENGSIINIDEDTTFSVEWRSNESLYDSANDIYGFVAMTYNGIYRWSNGKELIVSNTYPVRVYIQTYIGDTGSWSSDNAMSYSDPIELGRGQTHTFTEYNTGSFSYTINNDTITINSSDADARKRLFKVEARYWLNHTN